MSTARIFSLTFVICLFSTIMVTSTSVNAQITAHHIDSNGKNKIKYKDSNTSFELEYEGEIVLSEDDQDIVSISDGGYFELKKSAFGNKRRILIDAGRNGTLVRKYYVGRREKPYEPDGRKWLAETLPQVVRNTTIGAPERVRRYYDAGGTQAVLEEIRRLESDHVASHYYSLILDYDQSEQELNQILDNIGRTIESDHHMASLLRDHYDLFLDGNEMFDSYIKAAGEIDSDHHITDVLREVVNDRNINSGHIETLLSMARSIESDHHVANLLKELISSQDLNDTNLQQLIDVSGDVQSDHHKADVLEKLMRSQRNLDPTSVGLLLDGLSDVESDHHASTLIKEFSRQELDDANIARILDFTADNIESDHHAAESLMNVLSQHTLGNASLDATLRLLHSIESDHHAANVISKLGRNKELSENQLIKVLGYIGTLDSDHHLAESLTDLADLVSACGKDVHDAYRAAARKIHSETYYGRALRALD